MEQALSPYHDFMLEAVALGLQGDGRGAPSPCPNPHVGALLVREGQVLARGWHAAAGQPHAEVNCLAEARAMGLDPAGCTLVVTLEPCNHFGRTPPCTQAILEAGVKHVVIGALDPNPKAGGGAGWLAERGVRVESGVAEQACRDSLADFFVWQSTERPYVILKLASTLDGRIATRNSHSKWISCPEALERVQELRAWSQAVLVGGKTFYQDNPRLTRRPQGQQSGGDGPQPLAVVVTSRLPEYPERFHILRQRPQEAVFWTGGDAAAGATANALRGLGATVWGLPYLNEEKKMLDLRDGLDRLRAERGVHHLLCEGGGSLALRLLEDGLADELRLHLAPKILGDAQARPLFDGRLPLSMDEALQLRLCGAEICGGDLLLRFRRVN
ncbi:MAG: bifunctional diaminohydroxyphosphoribosylaminopyrimidine deaminase/5-amino-6-(5-phosphoribosylamino)uracil reductase RibD [Deltaproteobacteria bacterium]|jgi:diaminohydroxyphosphoribosylaminopyrimidine deaminase/5-amino-6-(5-phosphoribosylamino)uracil reductase|nr:bifunctional diaminohydroxyphosphoribosylaminopyrimidine deaminase/5-amino-6-(5-phosphoribosylamino)uracil reductase RibD [Deltaproteobacteria bacterium]